MEIESTCRKLLWTWGVEMSNKALITWDRFCIPQLVPRLNILDIKTWNKAVIFKLLWNLCRKKDKLWIHWVHIYYSKSRSIWATTAKQASWMIQKILKARNYVDEARYMGSSFLALNRFSIRKICINLKGDFQKVP